MALTKRFADGAKYEGDGTSRDIRWDEKVPGFGLRLYPSGQKSFVLQYRSPGHRLRLMTIGKFGVMTVDQARAMAKELSVEVAKGGDPLKARQAPGPVSLKEFVDTFLERHAKVQRRTWKEDRRRLKKWVLPSLGSKLLTDVERASVAALHSRIGKKAPVEANRVLGLLVTVFARAEEWGFVPEGHPNPAKRIQRFREQPRSRWLRPEEVRRLLEAIDQEKDPFITAALRLYLLTGLRKGELLSARWEHVDWDRCELSLPDTKAGRPHTLPLSPPAIQALRGIPRRLLSPWIFPGKDGGHRKDLKTAWARVRKNAGLQDATLHDLRRTVGSWMAQSGVPIQVIGQVLNHNHPDVTRIYARLSEDQSRAALDQVGRQLVELETARTSKGA